ncbi:hypothetical protein LEP1GSC132_0387 [Leptospira kirschneri str. 200803703]|uniref:SEC-C domain-containing protein n=1 Tax=Leptospira kirschneri TaxID=29507 RepID=UPI0002BDE93D|nr:SEC-C domain-containing protein [Leptospira kirschneri]EMO68635.1 hypothetical protein LEP1GSC132_0387 [Leptospira kirschneri str. 200803703]
MLNVSNLEKIKTDFEMLRGDFPKLSLIEDHKSLVVAGDLEFKADYAGETFDAHFLIELSGFENYPLEPPLAKELTGRTLEWHTNSDQTLCISAPVEVKRKYNAKRNLLGFVEDLLIPYFTAFLFWEKHGFLPDGEYSHGNEGILEFYKDYFNIRSERVIVLFLQTIIIGSYAGHLNCVCGSGKIFRKCHGEKILELKRLQSPRELVYDFFGILTFLTEGNSQLKFAEIRHKEVLYFCKKNKIFK